MPSIKEIRKHIKSVESTLKITNAMYLISSASLRKAKAHHDNVEPYFKKLAYSISDIFHHSPTLEHPFLDQRPQIDKKDRRIAYIVVTGDKGLAGAYNHNILKQAYESISQTEHPVLYVIGHMGRTYFNRKNIPIEADFRYSAHEPTIHKAREMTETLLDAFLSGEVDEIWIWYTDMINPLNLEPTLQKLLPLDKDNFPSHEHEPDTYRRTMEYIPSVSVVLNHLVPDFFSGMLFGSLVESYCSEQSARMTAMDSSTKNAKDMLKQLSLIYNRARQGAITQEITEIAGDAMARSLQS